MYVKEYAPLQRAGDRIRTIISFAEYCFLETLMSMILSRLRRGDCFVEVIIGEREQEKGSENFDECYGNIKRS